MPSRISDIFKQLRIRVANIMKKVPVKRRGLKGEKIARKKLEELGFKLERPQKRCEDAIAVKGDCRLPIQIKPLPLTRTNNEIHVDDTSLEDFEGLYIIWVERKDESIVSLYIPHQIFYDIMHKRGIMCPIGGIVRPHKNRWFLYIPRSLKGLEQYADNTIPDRYCEDEGKLLRELATGKPGVQ